MVVIGLGSMDGYTSLTIKPQVFQGKRSCSPKTSHSSVLALRVFLSQTPVTPLDLLDMLFFHLGLYHVIF